MAKDSEPPPDPDTQQQPQVPSTGVSTAPDGITTTSPPILGGGAGGSGASAAGGSGSQLAITKTTASGQPPSTMSLQQDAVQGILKSGLLTDPLQIAALQQQLSALVVSNSGGGLSVPLPPVNVTQVPLFRTANDSSVFHMNAMFNNLPQPSAQGAVTNMDGVFAILRQIASEHRVLMVSDRERNIEEKLKDVSNPMSKRSIEHDLRILECTNNIKACLSINGSVLVAGPFNLDVVNRALLLVMSSVQEIEDRVKADHSKHLVAQESNFGWKFVQSAEDLEKKVGYIDMVSLRCQEKAFAAHQAAVGGSSKWSDNDFLDKSSKPAGKGKNFVKNQKQKLKKKNKGKGKGKEHGVKAGKVNKGGPKNGCHRCGGHHYLVDCPKSVESMAQD
jgi:hypothetical protein